MVATGDPQYAGDKVGSVRYFRLIGFDTRPARVLCRTPPCEDEIAPNWRCPEAGTLRAVPQGTVFLDGRDIRKISDNLLRKEIGIMRAIGASPMRVITQIISESVVLTTFAGYFGLALGVGLLELINFLLTSSGGSQEMFYQPGVDFRAAVTALSILILSGAFAGFIPARRAVSVKPIDALRYE